MIGIFYQIITQMEKIGSISVFLSQGYLKDKIPLLKDKKTKKEREKPQQNNLPNIASLSSIRFICKHTRNLIVPRASKQNSKSGKKTKIPEQTHFEPKTAVFIKNLKKNSKKTKTCFRSSNDSKCTQSQFFLVISWNVKILRQPQ